MVTSIAIKSIKELSIESIDILYTCTLYSVTPLPDLRKTQSGGENSSKLVGVSINSLKSFPYRDLSCSEQTSQSHYLQLERSKQSLDLRSERKV